MAKNKQSVEAAERQLLAELKELAGRQFVYEDLWCGMVPFDGKLSELQTGPPVPFADLTWREQADVLRSFIKWDRYPERAWDDEYRIRDNIEAGEPPEAWLEGTSLRQSFQHLAEGKAPPPVQREPEIRQEDVANLLFKQGNPQHVSAPPKGKDLQKDGPQPEPGISLPDVADFMHSVRDCLPADARLQDVAKLLFAEATSAPHQQEKPAIDRDKLIRPISTPTASLSGRRTWSPNLGNTTWTPER